MKYEWDPAKAALNRKKHGASFEEAATIFDDPLALTFPDPDHSELELRQLTFGMSAVGRVLAIISTERNRGIRIISARKATRHERGIYEQD
jgi:uncharacterized protein